MNSHPSSVIADAKRTYAESGLGSFVRRGMRFKVVYPTLESLVAARSVSRPELIAEATDRGTIWFGDPEPPIRLSPPEHPILAETFGSYRYEYHPERPFVCEIDRARVLGDYAVGIAEDGRLLLESIDHGIREFVRLPRYAETRKAFLAEQLNPGRTTASPLDKPVVPFICWDSSYYHWITEYLPKLRLVEEYQEQTGHVPLLIIESDPSSYITESLAHAGFGSERWLRHDVVKRTSLNPLVLPMHRSHFFNHLQPSRSTYSPSRDDLHWLRERMLAATDHKVNGMDGGRRIYVSRQEATQGRKIANFGDLAPELERRGFECHVLERYSFAEQVALFRDAEVVMGPIGAGLVNMVWAENTRIIELFPQNDLVNNAGLVPHFYFLAQLMGFEYDAVMLGGDDDALVVDIDAFRTRLDEIDI